MLLLCEFTPEPRTPTEKVLSLVSASSQSYLCLDWYCTVELRKPPAGALYVYVLRVSQPPAERLLQVTVASPPLPRNSDRRKSLSKLASPVFTLRCSMALPPPPAPPALAGLPAVASDAAWSAWDSAAEPAGPISSDPEGSKLAP